jgi:hypothetical protein
MTHTQQTITGALAGLTGGGYITAAMSYAEDMPVWGLDWRQMAVLATLCGIVATVMAAAALVRRGQG